MLQRKLILSAFAVLAILSSCKKESNNDPEGTRLSKIIVRQVGSSPDSVGTIQFSYDNNNRLTVIDDRSFNMLYKNTFQYDAAGKLTKSERTYPTVSFAYVSTYAYQGNLLKSRTESNPLGIESTNNFTFTAAGKMATDTFLYTPTAITNDFYSKFTFDANNNLTVREDFWKNLPAGTWNATANPKIDATYNNSITNPFNANAVGALYYLTNTWLVPVVKDMLLSEHLLTSTTTRHSGGLTLVSTYAYEFYSSNNLPKKATITTTGGGSNYTIDFFYE